MTPDDPRSAGATISLAGGAFTYEPSVLFNGAGVNQLAGGTITLLDDVIPNLQLASGTILLSPSFQGGSITNLTLNGATLSGTNTVSGILNWTGGDLLGAMTIASGGVMNISGSTDLSLLAAVTNAGTINWSGPGNLILSAYSGSSALVNLVGGLFDAQNDQTIVCGCLGSEFFSNAGLFRKSAGIGTTTVGIVFTNTGTVEAQSGTVVFQSSYDDTSSATLAVSLGGPSAGAGYGHIYFASPLDVNAAFSATTRNGFRPNAGDTFNVLSYPSILNDLTCFGGLDLGGGLWLQPQMRRTGLTLTATAYPTNGLPSVFAARSPGKVRVFWTLGFPNWELVTSTNLFSPVWTPVPATNCDNQVVLPITAREQYFRLEKNN